jgi:hypothetical protein
MRVLDVSLAVVGRDEEVRFDWVDGVTWAEVPLTAVDPRAGVFVFVAVGILEEPPWEFDDSARSLVDAGLEAS